MELAEKINQQKGYKKGDEKQDGRFLRRQGIPDRNDQRSQMNNCP